MALLGKYRQYTGNQLTNMSSFLAKKKAAGMPITQRDTDLIYGSVLGGQADAYGDMLFRNQQMKKEENRWNKTFEQNKEIADANMEAQKQAGKGNAVKGIVQTGLLAHQTGLLDPVYSGVKGLFGSTATTPATYSGLALGGGTQAPAYMSGLGLGSAGGAAPVVGAGGAASSGLSLGTSTVPAAGTAGSLSATYGADVAAGGAGAGGATSTGLMGTVGTALAPVAGGVAGGMVGRMVSPWGEGHMGGERNTAGAIGAGAGAIIGGYAAAGTYVGGPIGAVIGGIVGALVAWIDW